MVLLYSDTADGADGWAERGVEHFLFLLKEQETHTYDHITAVSVCTRASFYRDIGKRGREVSRTLLVLFTCNKKIGILYLVYFQVSHYCCNLCMYTQIHFLSVHETRQ